MADVPAVAPARRRISVEKPFFKISGHPVRSVGMRNANGAYSEGVDRPPLKKFVKLVSAGRFITPRPPERVVMLGKHVIDVPPMFRAIKAGHKVPHFLIVDHLGNRRLCR